MEWWQQTPEVISEDYETFYVQDKSAAKREVDFVLSIANITPDSTILDLCCGTGRHAIELALQEHRVIGLDISKSFIHSAQEKAKSKGVTVKWICQDMRNIPYENSLDLVINMYGAWGYFDAHEDNQQVLFEVNKALKPGGLFLLDFFNHDWIIKNFQPFSWRILDDAYFLEHREFDILKGRHNAYVVVIKDNGKIKEWCTSVRGYTFTEINHMLMNANLITEGVFGGYDGSQFGLETPQLLILARKA